MPDTSGGVHVGKWFKKQSLARHYLPIIRVASIEASEEGEFVSLRVTNPSYLSHSQGTSLINRAATPSLHNTWGHYPVHFSRYYPATISAATPSLHLA